MVRCTPSPLGFMEDNFSMDIRARGVVTVEICGLVPNTPLGPSWSESAASGLGTAAIHGIKNLR